MVQTARPITRASRTPAHARKSGPEIDVATHAESIDDFFNLAFAAPLKTPVRIGLTTGRAGHTISDQGGPVAHGPQARRRALVKRRQLRRNALLCRGYHFTLALCGERVDTRPGCLEIYRSAQDHRAVEICPEQDRK
ncbi:MAG TPA: hypothetical protein DCG06_06765 [Deltaproteobacteria bacterium]|nr:hypothetical protein [Deltaproteobacteria bacterium]